MVDTGMVSYNQGQTNVFCQTKEDMLHFCYDLTLLYQRLL